LQHQHVQEAVKNPALFAKANGGRPAIAATPKPAAFNAPGVVGAHGAAPLPAKPAGGPTPGAPQNANHPNGNAPPPTAATHAEPAGHPVAAGQQRDMHAQAPGGAKPPAPKPQPPKPQAKPQPKPQPKPEGKKHDDNR
jgi:colicin import membrane protein